MKQSLEEPTPGEIPGGVLEGISVGCYVKIPRGIRRCILAEVYAKISEGIVGGFPGAFIVTSPETIPLGTPQVDQEVPTGTGSGLFGKFTKL